MKEAKIAIAKLLVAHCWAPVEFVSCDFWGRKFGRRRPRNRLKFSASPFGLSPFGGGARWWQGDLTIQRQPPVPHGIGEMLSSLGQIGIFHIISAIEPTIFQPYQSFQRPDVSLQNFTITDFEASWFAGRESYSSFAIQAD